MAGLIQNKMMGPSEGDETNEKEPVEGTGPDGSPQHEGMEGEAPERGDTSGEPDTENPAFIDALKMAMEALYKGQAASDVAKQIKAAQDPVQALADISYEMVSVVDERTNGEVPDDLIMLLAISILKEVGDIAEAAGIELTAPQIGDAFKQMLLRYLGENGVDTTQLQQSMDQIDPKVFEQAQQGA